MEKQLLTMVKDLGFSIKFRIKMRGLIESKIKNTDII
jgi:hypothetical protein